MQQRVLMYDKSGEEHYNLISALHKSVRNSDPDAALYWLGRMFAGGEDPLYLARRIVRMAVEDIGLAAPEALNLCLSAKDTYDFLGSPEGDLALAEAVVYLALAPKSNAVYTAYGAVQDDIEHTRQEPVPLHLRNAPTKLMKELGYARRLPLRARRRRQSGRHGLPARLAQGPHATTIPRRKAARSSWRSGWKRFAASRPKSETSNAQPSFSARRKFPILVPLSPCSLFSSLPASACCSSSRRRFPLSRLSRLSRRCDGTQRVVDHFIVHNAFILLVLV